MHTLKALIATATLTAVVSAPTVSFAASRGAGDERINTTVANTQDQPAIAVYDKGWVAVWQSREGSLDLEIRARAFSPTGDSAEIDVNTVSLGTQQRPAVACDAMGNFAVTWYGNEPSDAGGDDSGFGVSARLFLADGTPRGPEFQVNDLTTGHQMDPAIAMAPDGTFVITWRSSSSAGTDDSGASVQARRFAADGTPLGASFQVNTYTQFDQQYPAVAMAENGRFVVAWQSLLQDGSIDGIYARRFAAGGTPLSGETQVNVQTSGSQSLPAVAVAHDGRYMIVWQSEEGNDLEVRGRLYAASGQVMGSEIDLNTLIDGHQTEPSISAMHDGFLTAWQSTTTAGNDDDGFSIQLRVFDFDGQPSGSEMQVNTAVVGNQLNPVVGSSSFNMVVAWDSDHQSATDEDIYAFQEQMARSKQR